MSELEIIVAKLEEKFKNIEIHFTNHVAQHRIDKILQAIYFLSVIVMFCYLKWGS